ncbi:MAG: universal stress protein [Chitinophagales bacterium]
MKNILVPTDFSPYSANAFNYALQMAHRANALLTILHDYHVPVINQFNHIANIHALLEAIEPIASDSFIERVKAVHSDEILENTQFNYIYDANLTIDTIIELTKKEQFDYLIVASKKRNALRRLFFSSSLAAIINQVHHCAVLAVPENANYHAIKRISCATKLKLQTSAFEQMKLLHQMFQRRIHFVHVVSDSEKSDNKAKKQVFRQKVGKTIKKNKFFLHEIIHHDIEDALFEYIEKQNVDLLCLAAHPEKALLARLFSSNLIETLTADANIPIMIFPINGS